MMCKKKKKEVSAIYLLDLAFARISLGTDTDTDSIPDSR